MINVIGTPPFKEQVTHLLHEHQLPVDLHTTQLIIHETGSDELNEQASHRIRSTPVHTRILTVDPRAASGSSFRQWMNTGANDHLDAPSPDELIEAATSQLHRAAQLPQPVIELRGLGRATVTTNNGRGNSCGRSTELLLYLNEHPEAFARDILEDIWPNGQLASLHSTIYRTRRLVGPDVIIQRGLQYHLRPGSYSSDISNFERRASIALSGLHNPAVLEHLASEANNPLTGINSSWADRVRERIEQVQAQLLLEASIQYARAGQPERSRTVRDLAFQLNPFSYAC